jgi:hypothetical protein
VSPTGDFGDGTFGIYLFGGGGAVSSSTIIFRIDAAFGSYPGDTSYTWTEIHSTDHPYLDYTLHTGNVRGVQWQRGIGDLLGRTETGSGTVILRNQTRWWDPQNVASPFYPNVRPGLPIRMRGIVNGVEYPVFQHFADGFPQQRHGPSYSEVPMGTIDAFARLALASPSPEVASLLVDPAGVNNTILFTAVNPGIAEQDITVQMIGGPFKPVRVSVKGKAIEIRYHLTGLHGDPDDTAAIIIAAVNAHGSANKLVVASNGPGSDGTGSVLTDFGPTNLTGGDAASFPQELTGARISRCLDQGGWPAALRGIDVGTVEVVAAPFSSNEQGRLLSHVLDVAGEPGEFGLVYVDGRGYCVFLDRNSLYSNGSQGTYAATFSDRRADGFPIYVDSEPNTDREHVINEWQGSREGGVAIIVRDDDSITKGYGLGRVTHSVSSLLTKDSKVKASLEFGRDEYGQPVQVLSSLTVMPGNDLSLWATCLGIDVGDRVRVLSHPPGGGAAIDEVYFVTKVAGQLGIGPTTSGRFAYGLTPIRLNSYFVWNDPVYGDFNGTNVLAYN